MSVETEAWLSYMAEIEARKKEKEKKKLAALKKRQSGGLGHVLKY